MGTLGAFNTIGSIIGTFVPTFVTIPVVGTSIPFQMSSTEFFTLMKEHLNDGGVMVVNMNMRGSKEENINQYFRTQSAGSLMQNTS